MYYYEIFYLKMLTIFHPEDRMMTYSKRMNERESHRIKRRYLRNSIAVVGATLGLGLAGCEKVDQSSITDIKIVTINPPMDESGLILHPLGGLSGRFTILDNCVYFQGEKLDPNNTTPSNLISVVFPRTVKVVLDKAGIYFKDKPSGSIVRVGKSFSGNGSISKYGSNPNAPTIPEECRKNDVVTVFTWSPKETPQ